MVYMTQLVPSGGLDDHGRLRALIYQAIADGGFRGVNLRRVKSRAD